MFAFSMVVYKLGLVKRFHNSSLLSDCQVSQPGSWFWQISARELLRPQQSRNDITVQADTLVRGSTPCCMSPGQSCVRELTALPEHLPDREGAWAVKPSRRFESWCSDWLLIILFLERHLTFNSWVSFYWKKKKDGVLCWKRFRGEISIWSHVYLLVPLFMI